MRWLPRLLAFVVLLTSGRALGWGSQGHMMVAASAWEQIEDTAVKKKIVKLLKVNPQYASWVKGVAPADRDEVAFVIASTWPDWIKRNAPYENDGDDNGETAPNVPASSQNIGYTDHLRHKYWHYIDLPFSTDGTAKHDPQSVNAKTQLALLKAALKSASTSAKIKSYDLVWLEHLVGDVHQPLHCTSRFNKDQKDGDRGGNSVSLCNTPNCKAELHALWDGFPGTSNQASVAIKKALKLPDADPDLAQVLDESVWVEESFKEAQKSVYAAPIGPRAGPYETTPEYRKHGREVSAERVALAGARLANLLTEALK